MEQCDKEIDARRDLQIIDWVVIVGYFAFVLFIGLYSSYRSKRASVQGYFLASRSMHWLPVGASLFASNIGSGHFIGLAGSGAASGIAPAGFELNAIFILVLLGWIFVPVYMSAGVYTMPEYLRLRFGGQRIRVYLAVLALILYIFTKISADIYAGGLFIQLALGFEGDFGLYISILILLGIAALFTIAGGLTAVIWTDFVQTILMIIGASILSIVAFKEVGGLSGLEEKYMNAVPSDCAAGRDKDNVSCGAVDPDAMHLFRHVGHDELPWTGLIIGTTITSLWYWCSDQVIVQRALAAKNMTHAKAGCIVAGILKLSPMFLLVFPGMAARILYTDKVACADPDYCFAVCGSRSGCTNIAYAELVLNLLSPGLAGMMLAVMMAALMSSLTSIFNSSSTIFTIDIWTRFRSNASDTEKLLVGRASILILLCISILWVPILKEVNSSQLFIYTQQVSIFLSPPVAAVFVLALFVPRTNESGAFWGLMIGLAVGMVRFIVEFGFPEPSCGSTDLDNTPNFIRNFNDFHYLHFGILLFVFSAIVTYVISLFSDPIPPEKLYRLTFATRHSTKVRVPIDDQEEEIQKKAQGKDPTPAPISIRDEDKPDSLVKKILNRICGSEENKMDINPELEMGPKLTPEEEAVEAAKFLEEDKFGKNLVNGAALAVGLVAVAIWVYWA